MVHQDNDCMYLASVETSTPPKIDDDDDDDDSAVNSFTSTLEQEFKS